LFLYTSNKVDIDPRFNIKAIIKGLYNKELNLKSYNIILLFTISIRIIS